MTERRSWVSWSLAAGGAAFLLAGLLLEVRAHADVLGIGVREDGLEGPSHLLLIAGLALSMAAGFSWCRPGALVPIVPTARVIVLGLLLAMAMSGDTLEGGLAAGYASIPGVADHEVVDERAHTSTDGFDVPSSHDETSLLHLSASSLVVTDAQQTAASGLVQDTRAHAERFADTQAARAAGYVELLSDAGTEPGFFYLYNRTLLNEGARLNPDRPGALGYLRLSEGDLLLGVMYLAPAGEGPRIGGGLTIWRPHESLCLDGELTLLSTVDREGRCPPLAGAGPHRFESLRVWTFDHPRGAFAAKLSREDVLTQSRPVAP